MKVARPSLRKNRINLKGDTFSLSHAKTYLGRLMEKASKGQAIYIRSGERRFILQIVPAIDPIPMRPRGYFAACYTAEEARELNRLAKASAVSAPADLE